MSSKKAQSKSQVACRATRPPFDSNCTMYWGGILDRQMHRGLVHALDRYCMCYITMSEHVHARPLFAPLGFESMLV